jgi:hypothetical protein
VVAGEVVCQLGYLDKAEGLVVMARLDLLLVVRLGQVEE